ncbi:MAG: family 78 glycoside hydrolase catalytic domain, partial [Chitinophagaceae bacterium]
MMRNLVALLFFLSAFYSLFAQNTLVTNLQVEYDSAPLGVESRHPKLSWQLVSSQRNVLQTAYRILVADNPLMIIKNIGNVWDTEKIASSQSIQSVYAGQDLQPAKTYYWKVMVWDNHNSISPWSKTASWQMGLLTQADWKDAQWIAYDVMPDSMRLEPKFAESKRKEIKDVLPLVRKEFLIRKPIKKAAVFIAGLGHFELSVNGEKTGDHFLDAGWTNYDKQALYVTFDITRQLRKGSNAIGVMLGNGFYFIPGERYRKLQTAYGYPKMICRVLIEYTDGTADNIMSDPSWRSAPGGTTFSSIFGGEDFDANLVPAGWNSRLFNDTAWKNVVTVEGPPLLNSQTAAPIKIFENFAPKKITRLKTGVWVYDFGQNASAIPRLSVKGKKGSVVRLSPAELLQKDGSITTEPIGTPVYFEYKLKGEGVETWQPSFMYYGFRYVQVEGAVPEGKENTGGLPVVMAMKSLHTRNAAPRVGAFSCSNELFNNTNRLIDWSVRSNMS